MLLLLHELLRARKWMILSLTHHLRVLLVLSQKLLLLCIELVYGRLRVVLHPYVPRVEHVLQNLVTWLTLSLLQVTITLLDLSVYSCPVKRRKLVVVVVSISIVLHLIIGPRPIRAIW